MAYQIFYFYRSGLKAYLPYTEGMGFTSDPIVSYESREEAEERASALAEIDDMATVMVVEVHSMFYQSEWPMPPHAAIKKGTFPITPALYKGRDNIKGKTSA